jgi:hypothetical protein
VSASEIEAAVLDALRAAYPDDADLTDRALIEARAERILVRVDSILIHAAADLSQALEVAWSRPVRRGRREILAANASDGRDRGIKVEARIVLLRSIALGRRWLDEILHGATVDQIAAREGCTSRHAMNTIGLAFLAPPIVHATIEARLPRGISTRAIGEPDLEWSRQWNALGIGAPAP